MDMHIQGARREHKAIQEIEDFVHTGPDTLAGRYLRRFWQPIHLSHDLKAGWSIPLRVLGEDLTLYRGETGTPFVVGHKCAHRGVQLSAGTVEGNDIRCAYHGWKYDGSGQCIEQPGTPNSFADKVRIKSYPAVERLGMIFAYMGEGQPPAPRHYPLFENA